LEHGLRKPATPYPVWRSKLMSSLTQDRASFKLDPHRGPHKVAMPAPHEGVRRALLGSFGSIPAMPDEFLKLLDKLR